MNYLPPLDPKDGLIISSQNMKSNASNCMIWGKVTKEGLNLSIVSNTSILGIKFRREVNHLLQWLICNWYPEHVSLLLSPIAFSFSYSGKNT